MKKFLFTLLIPIVALSSSLQGFEAEAVLIKPGNGGNFRGWIIAATKTQIRYKTNKVSTAFVDENISAFETIHVLEPAEFAEAIDLYEGRKYKEARDRFAKIKENFKPLSNMVDNYHTLSGFYEMECARHLSDYTGLATLLKDFIKAPITRDYQIRQLDLYTLWDAVRAEDWERVLSITLERENEKLPIQQRAQVAYGKGLALDKLNRDLEAVIAYNMAITADAGASEILAQQAAINSLAIYRNDQEVQTAINNWDTEDENKNSNGYTRLLEAVAIYKVYIQHVGLGKPLPAELEEFSKFAKQED